MADINNIPSRPSNQNLPQLQGYLQKLQTLSNIKNFDIGPKKYPIIKFEGGGIALKYLDTKTASLLAADSSLIFQHTHALFLEMGIREGERGRNGEG